VAGNGGKTRQRLGREFQRLKKLLDIAEELKLVWIPNGSDKLCGEVKGKTVFIYDHSYESALETLKHEIIDYLVCKAIEPYKDLLNQLTLFLNERAYKEKEEIVERIVRVFDGRAN